MEAADFMFLTFSIIILSSGIALNMFIAVVSYRNRSTHGFQSPRELIIFSVGLSSALVQGLQMFVFGSFFLWTDVVSSLNVCTICIDAFSTVSIFFTFCLTSWLCSFYCIKLVSLQHRLLTFLRSRLFSVFSWTIRVTFGFCIVFPILQLGVIFMSVPLDYTGNSTIYCPRVKAAYYTNVQLIRNGSFYMIAIPFLVILVSLSSTLTSLLVNICRVQRSCNLDNSHLRAHVSAATTMTLLLTLNAAFYISQVLLRQRLFPPSSPVFWICMLLQISFWKFLALILIFRTKKLKGIIQSALQSALKRKCDANQ